MEKLENFRSMDAEMLTPFNRELPMPYAEITLHMRVLRREVVAQALKELWQESGLDGEPLIFYSPVQGRMATEHHPMLLDQHITNSQQAKDKSTGQLASWERIDAPAYAHGIGVGGGVVLFKADMLRSAGTDDQHTLPGVECGWKRYSFTRGWTALSACFYDGDDNDGTLLTFVAVPAGCQDEWLVCLKALDTLRTDITRRERRGRIEIIGASNNNNDLVPAILKTSFDDVVLAPETLAQVSAQRRIFDEEILRRYAALGVPRLRKVLLIGPPGTGKTTLLKAEGARHAKQGGLVFYVCAPPKGRGTTSWQQLSAALRGACDSRLPTLVLVEDFEMFVSDPQELQLVLNTLDGVATPDNPAGTLLLATSNDPEKIDQRIRDRPGRVDLLIEIGLVEDVELAARFLKHFLGTAYREEEHASLAPLLLKQPGSHFREVCISGAMRALEMERTDVLREDLLWAHEAIINGRSVATQSERFMPAPARSKRAGFFSKDR